MDQRYGWLKCLGNFCAKNVPQKKIDVPGVPLGSDI